MITSKSINVLFILETNGNVTCLQHVYLYFYILTHFEILVAVMSQKKRFLSSWKSPGRCLLSQSAVATSKEQNYCFGEAGGTWSTFAPGQLCLGRAPLRLQWSAVCWGVFRQMWRAACDQCHCNFSLVIMWWWTRLTDANLAAVTWMEESCLVLFSPLRIIWPFISNVAWNTVWRPDCIFVQLFDSSVCDRLPSSLSLPFEMVDFPQSDFEQQVQICESGNSFMAALWFWGNDLFQADDLENDHCGLFCAVFLRSWLLHYYNHFLSVIFCQLFFYIIIYIFIYSCNAVMLPFNVEKSIKTLAEHEPISLEPYHYFSKKGTKLYFQWSSRQLHTERVKDSRYKIYLTRSEMLSYLRASATVGKSARRPLHLLLGEQVSARLSVRDDDAKNPISKRVSPDPGPRKKIICCFSWCCCTVTYVHILTNNSLSIDPARLYAICLLPGQKKLARKQISILLKMSNYAFIFPPSPTFLPLWGVHRWAPPDPEW